MRSRLLWMQPEKGWACTPLRHSGSAKQVLGSTKGHRLQIDQDMQQLQSSAAAKSAKDYDKLLVCGQFRRLPVIRALGDQAYLQPGATGSADF